MHVGPADPFAVSGDPYALTGGQGGAQARPAGDLEEWWRRLCASGTGVLYEDNCLQVAAGCTLACASRHSVIASRMQPAGISPWWRGIAVNGYQIYEMAFTPLDCSGLPVSLQPHMTLIFLVSGQFRAQISNGLAARSVRHVQRVGVQRVHNGVIFFGPVSVLSCKSTWNAFQHIFVPWLACLVDPVTGASP